MNKINNSIRWLVVITLALLVSCATTHEVQARIQQGGTLRQEIQSAAPGMPVLVIPKWKTGDTKRFMVRMESEEYEDTGLVKKSGSKYDVSLAVVDATSSGYTMEWRLGIIRVMPEAELEMEGFSGKEFIRMVEGLRIIYRTDASGAFAELVNRDEMQKHMLDFLDKYVDVLKRIKPDADQRRKAISPNISVLKDFLSSKEMIEAQYTKEIKLFHAPLGGQYKLKEPGQTAAFLPNILGGPSILGKVNAEMTELSPDGKDCKIELRMQLDAEAVAESAREFTDKMMKQLDKTFSQPPPPPARDLDLENHTKYEIDLQSGWIRMMKSVGRNRLGSRTIVSTVEISQASDRAGETGGSVETDLEFVSRGLTYLKEKKYDQAISDLSSAIGITPQYGDAYFYRGTAYAGRDQGDQAISDFTHALQINPKYARAFVARGIVYQKKGQYDQAISDFTKVLEINPRNAGAYGNRGRAYRYKGQYDQAISDFNKALEFDPKHAPTYFHRGLTLEKKGQYDEAISDYMKALEINPGFAAAYNELAWLFATAQEARIRDGEKALELAIKACQLTNFENPYYLGTMAAAYARTGDFDNAIGWQEKALDFHKTDQKREAQRLLELYRNHKPWPPD